MSSPMPNPEVLKSDIRLAVINDKANACPMMVRLAWHASGTWCEKSKTGGSSGGTMRFEPEVADGANAGLTIAQDMLRPVKEAHPEVSHGDLWTLAGAAAVEFSGGPKIPHHFCRADAPDGSHCPPIGRLPDASQGAAHLRDVFYRMGFDDKAIVALSGAHTLGRCHLTRSGFDGPWTTDPLRFDNEYFRNLLYLEWRKRDWDGPEQYEDVKTGKLMMLPTDMCLIEDPDFRPFVELYATDERAFFRDYAEAFSKLLHAGCPHRQEGLSEKDRLTNEFREAAMHGSLDAVKSLSQTADVHAVESASGRSALHKAAFWGHEATAEFLVRELSLDLNQVDSNGDTPLHDAARFGHAGCAKILLEAGADTTIKNKSNKDVLAVATEAEKPEVVELLKAFGASKL